MNNPLFVYSSHSVSVNNAGCVYIRSSYPRHYTSNFQSVIKVRNVSIHIFFTMTFRTGTLSTGTPRTCTPHQDIFWVIKSQNETTWKT